MESVNQKINESKIIWNLTYMLHVLGLAPTQEDFDNIFYSLREDQEQRWRSRMVRFSRWY